MLAFDLLVKEDIFRGVREDLKNYFYDTGAVEGDFSAKLENVITLAICGSFTFWRIQPAVKLHSTT